MMDAGRRAELDTHDTCFLDVMPNHWAYRAVTAANKITFYAKAKPTVSIPLQIRCIRK